MPSKYCITLLVCQVFRLVLPSIVNAGSIGFVSSPLVDHPIHNPVYGRIGSQWRLQAGKWGENFAEETLRLRGYNEVREIKFGGNNGIDRVALKRGKSGALLDFKLVEVKTSRSAKPKLGSTRYGGIQMSRRWLAQNFIRMRQSGDPDLKKLALELSRFRQGSGRPIESFGELIHINAESGRITGYSADGRLIKYSRSSERSLTQIQKRAGSSQARRWATQTLARWDQIRSTNESSWLGKSVRQQTRKALLMDSGRGFVKTQMALLLQSR